MMVSEMMVSEMTVSEMTVSEMTVSEMTVSEMQVYRFFQIDPIFSNFSQTAKTAFVSSVSRYLKLQVLIEIIG